MSTLKDILATALMGLGGTSEALGRGMEQRAKSRDEYMNDLQMLYVKQLLEQQDPYRQAMTKESLARADYYKKGGGGGGGGGGTQTERDRALWMQLTPEIENIKAGRQKKVADIMSAVGSVKELPEGAPAPKSYPGLSGKNLTTNLQNILSEQTMPERFYQSLEKGMFGKEEEDTSVIENAMNMYHDEAIPSEDAFIYLLENGGDINSFIARLQSEGVDIKNINTVIEKLGL